MFGVLMSIYYRQQLPSVSLKLKGADLTCVFCFNFEAFPNPSLGFTSCVRILDLPIKSYPTSNAVWENIHHDCKGESNKWKPYLHERMPVSDGLPRVREHFVPVVATETLRIVAYLTDSNDLIVTYTVKMVHNIFFLKFYLWNHLVCIFHQKL